MLRLLSIRQAGCIGGQESEWGLLILSVLGEVEVYTPDYAPCRTP